MLTLRNHFGEISAALFACLVLTVGFIAVGNPLIALGLAFAPVVAYYFLRNAFYLCLLFIIFSFFRIHEAYMFLQPLRIPSMLAAGAIGMLFWKTCIERSLKPYWSKEFNYFVAFFVLVTFGMTVATNFPTAWAYWSATYIKIFIMVFAIAWMARKPEDFSTASIFFVLAGIAVGGLAIYNKLNGIGLIEETRVTISRNIGSILGDPNDLSLVLLFPLSFAMSNMVYRTSKPITILSAIGTFTILYGIICTQSRGGLLGILAVSGIVSMRVIKNKMILMCVGGLAALVLVAAAGISKRASGGAHEEGIGESGMGRIYAWTAAYNMANARPLTGLGIDNFLVNYYAFSPHWDGLNHAVHSTWFGVLGETGYPGIVVFISMVVTLIRSLRKADHILQQANAPPELKAISLALLAGITGFCVSATFLTQGFNWPLYVLLALGVAMCKFAKDLKAQTQTE